MIKTNSELPLTMLKDYNIALNQYDFVLFHLIQQYKEYEDYFNRLRLSNPERLMILDNSAYEFYVKNEKLDLDEFEATIVDLMPDYFILPDVLMNLDATIKGTEKFLKEHDEALKVSKPLGVLQGNSYEDFDTCLQFYKDHNIEAIAIPFHNSFFKEKIGNNLEYSGIEYLFLQRYGYINEDIRYAIGRCMWVYQNKEKLDKIPYVHLLGSHCPYEKVVHERMYAHIDSMDTGYPVKCAIEGEILYKEDKKPNIIIDDFMTKEIHQDIKNLIRLNIMRFASGL